MVEIVTRRTDFELGVPESKKRLEEAKQRKAKLLEERIEIQKELKKARKEQETIQKKKLKKKGDILKKIGKLTEAKPKGIKINEVARAKLLRELIQKKKRPVSVLRTVEDKIPSVFVNGKEREEPRKGLSFLGKGGIL